MAIENSRLGRAMHFNGMKMMVPPFIAAGELIRVDVERAAYVERVRKKSIPRGREYPC